MSKDVRKEQIVLLQFEKRLAALAAFVATGAATAASASDKINGEATTKAYQELQAAIVHLGDVTSAIHSRLEAAAVEAGARALEASGGAPKDPVGQVVRSILGIG